MSEYVYVDIRCEDTCLYVYIVEFEVRSLYDFFSFRHRRLQVYVYLHTQGVAR